MDLKNGYYWVANQNFATEENPLGLRRFETEMHLYGPGPEGRKVFVSRFMHKKKKYEGDNYYEAIREGMK